MKIKKNEPFAAAKWIGGGSGAVSPLGFFPYAKGTICTPKGKISIAWEQKTGKIEIHKYF